MSHSIHLNQLSSVVAEYHEDDAEIRSRDVIRALQFLEGVDYEDETLRLRRRRRQREAGGIAGFMAARASCVQ